MLLEFENVSGIKKRFKKSFVLEDVSFSLEKGYIMGLTGKNGAGKTTLIDYIVNPKKRYNGTIRINGEDIRENHCNMMNKIGFVSEENQFFEDMSISRNALLLSRFYDDWDDELFKNTLKKLGVASGTIVGILSRGERMKMQMAFAMAHHPVLYLLDEVTAGMDPVFRIDFFKVLQEIIADENASILMTSHIKEEMDRKMDYVITLENGRLLERNGI